MKAFDDGSFESNRFENKKFSPAMKWFDAIQHCQQSGVAYALITVLGCTGSTPRDQGSKMVITGDATFDTIGGGHLEFVVTNKAREMIAEGRSVQEIQHFPLGASLGQCCGGSATVLVETFAGCQFNIGLFGAGHVAKSLVSILSGLPCKVTWVDSREEEFPASVPANVSKVVTDDPCGEIATLPEGADVLILTHNHQLDYELCVAALKRLQAGNALRHVGLIGSDTKAQRFVKRLEHRGFSLDEINQIKCPVGLSEVPGKLPMEVAVSIAGELIAIENDGKVTQQKRGLAWKDIKQELGSELGAEVNTEGQGAVLTVKNETIKNTTVKS
ncbi:xanthine dehydrogenase accessory protein XdhC [Litoribrevibacter albus]|nr:xanthine dehydrogenase accessory protein XdhC [Litoribrevibacter albus]